MCDCIQQIERQMRDSNTEFVKAIRTDPDTGKWIIDINIEVAKINPRGKKPIHVVINYCPFCGEKRKQSEDQ